MAKSELLRDDIRNLFIGFAAAIELDQIRVDSLPASRFHRHYDRGVWVGWRNEHIKFYCQMAATVHDLPAEVLEQLTVVANNYDPKDGAEAVLNISSNLASAFDESTATGFLKQLITDVCRERKPIAQPAAGSPIDQILRWFPVEDPLRIAQDEETGYGRLLGFVN
jgi:hypothetical protein